MGEGEGNIKHIYVEREMERERERERIGSDDIYVIQWTAPYKAGAWLRICEEIEWERDIYKCIDREGQGE